MHQFESDLMCHAVSNKNRDRGFRAETREIERLIPCADVSDGRYGGLHDESIRSRFDRRLKESACVLRGRGDDGGDPRVLDGPDPLSNQVLPDWFFIELLEDCGRIVGRRAGDFVEAMAWIHIPGVDSLDRKSVV